MGWCTAFDACTKSESQHFLLRGLLLWTISDFPTYGLISEQQMKGYRACSMCGPNVMSRSTRGPKKEKVVFVGARQRLPIGHHF